MSSTTQSTLGTTIRSQNASISQSMTSFSSRTADEALLQMVRALRDCGYQSTTVTPATHERVNTRSGSEWAADLRDVFGWSRPFRSEILPPNIWEAMRRADIALPHGEGWRSSLRVSSLSGHLFLHSAYPTGEADAVFFGPDTYRFANAIQSHLTSHAAPIRRAVDIGCGAGPGAILCAVERPDATVFAVDINEAALRLTRLNATLAGASNVEARHSDLLTNIAGDFDLIVANPPYLVDPAERAYRHGGGPLGAGLSLAIVDAALGRFAPQGTLLLYTGAAIMKGVDPFREAVAQRLCAADVSWAYREVDPDVFGEELSDGAYQHADRIAAVVLTVSRSTAQS